MANGLLGKKVVGSRDTELVYTVPASRVSTMNVNIINNGANSGNVFLYVSDKTYQSKDFETYNAQTDSWTIDSEDYSDIAGFGQATGVIGLLKNTSNDITNTGAVSVEKTRSFTVDNAAGTMSVSQGNHNGMPIGFAYGTDFYVRSANNGSTYTLTNYKTAGSVTSSASSWGQSSSDNNRWAVNVEESHGVAYVGGTPASGTTNISTISDWRHQGQASYNNFSWAAGAISNMSGIKTGSGEFFLTGVVFGSIYISSNGAPTTSAMLQSSNFNLAQVTAADSGIMVGAASVPSQADGAAGKIFIALSNNRVIYADFTNAAPTSTTSNWEYYFAFPSGITTWEDLVDVRAGDALNELQLVTANTIYSTTNLGVTYTTKPNTGTMPFNITMAADADGNNKYAIDTVIGGELELVRGRKYKFFLQDSTMNSHPFLLSATSDGAHASGTNYLDGIVYKFGNPTNGDYSAITVTTTSTITTGHTDYNNSPRWMEFTVPSNAPNKLYTYCHVHPNMGFAIDIVDETTSAPLDDETTMFTGSVRAASGDVTKKFDVLKNGETYNREKRFTVLPDQDMYDKAGLSSGAVLERTGLMASAGEQVIVKTDGEGVVVRVHGIEE
jgi:hypothetical protein